MNISEKTFLLYDGECPFCDNYIKLLKLKSILPELQLLNAHSHKDLVDHFRNEGLEINDGMIFSLDESIYYGPDCIHALTVLADNNSFFSRLNKIIFKNKKRAKILYPILVHMRKLYFTIMRKSLIE